MHFLIEFLANRIHPEWWVFKVVAWYCEKREIELPKGRCHFGEIFLFYAPAYLALGLLFKVILGVLVVLGFILAPVISSIRWFVRRLDEEGTTHPVRPLVILALAFTVFLVTNLSLSIVGEIQGRGEEYLLTIVIPSIFAVFVITFVGLHLAIWTTEALYKYTFNDIK